MHKLQLRTVRFAYCHFITDQVLQVWFQLLVRMKAASISTGKRTATTRVTAPHMGFPLSPLQAVSIKGLKEAITNDINSTQGTLNQEQQQELIKLKMMMIMEKLSAFESQLGISIVLE
ncbi:hypothetical protein EON65_51680 [archaeon]|nr:MAG: hypothetical protein EON65_51680 [archaeon]